MSGLTLQMRVEGDDDVRVAVGEVAVPDGYPVFDWNTPSIRFYRKLGATLRKEWILTRLTGVPLRRLAAKSR